jgi:glycosyltransferase involved in cell wall biosynthesis
VRHATATDHEVVIPVRRVGGVTDEAAEGHLRAAGATVHHLGMRRTPWSPANAAALARLVRLIRRTDPDVVHGHSSIGGLLARLAAAGTGRPRVYTPNGVTDVRVGRWVERALAPLTDRVVAVSPSEAERVVALHLAPTGRVATIPNGIDLAPADRIDLRTRLGIDAATPLVGSIARLVPQKAPLDLVAAASAIRAQIPEARFVLVGDGAMAEEVDAAIRRAGLEGALDRIPVLPGAAGMLADLDVFLLTSRFEGGPYAPLEAMREGTAVVLTDVVGSRDAVEDGRTGLLVPPEDPDAAAAAVVGLLRDPDRRGELASTAWARVAEHFDVRAMGAAHDALYADLTRSPRRARKEGPS